MKPHTIGLTLMLGVAMTLTGCNKGEEKAAVPGDAPKVEAFPEGTKVTDLFPATPGAQSTFSAGGTVELTLKITDVKDQGENKIVTMQTIEQNKVSDTMQWQVGPTGIFQLNARNGKAYNPMQLSAGPDFNNKEEVKYAGKGPFPSVETGKPDYGDIQGSLKNRGIETVDTNMGQIQALAVESAYLYESAGKKYRILNTTWFAPKYGIVRMVQTTQREDNFSRSLTMKLKGFRSK
ncbi:MAG: hypothetical protein ACKVQS_06805 [Fimbriimonadaceae bacterium]